MLMMRRRGWIILAAAAFSYWSAARAAAERAEALGRDACRAAGVQWLDQTVHATGLRLRRLPAAPATGAVPPAATPPIATKA